MTAEDDQHAPGDSGEPTNPVAADAGASEQAGPGPAGPAPATVTTDGRGPDPQRRLGALTVMGLIVMIILLLLHTCAAPANVVTVVAAGDMACDPIDPAWRDPASARTTDGRPPANPLWCREKDVSDIAVSVSPQALLGLGDYQYEVPSTQAFASTYGPTWGRMKAITIPAIGNQEYKVHEANTFTGYFAGQTGPQQHYWSTTLGSWHVVILNSNCTVVTGGCGLGSPQQKWLAADLDANTSRCTLALWHHPRWSNGITGPDTRTNAMFATLAEHRVDILLSGHEADYERFGKLDGDGHPSLQGVRQFVVGTGGQVVYDPAGEPNRAATGHNQTEELAADALAYPDSEFVDFAHPGVLALQLGPRGYAWAFHAVNVNDAEPNDAVTDSGTSACNRS